MKKALIGFACMAAATTGVAVSSTPEIPPSDSETIESENTVDNRVTIPVSVDGQGPFDFIVDTGAERTVISRELAETLELHASEDVWLTTILNVEQVPTVIIPRLGAGRRTVDEIQAPALARTDLGAAGVLGIDALEDQQVLFDFEQDLMTFSEAQIEESDWSEGDVIVVRARQRSGRLVLARANVEGTRIHAIVDTGSAVTIGNNALRERLIRRGRMDPNQFFTITSVTGSTMDINYAFVDELRIGSVRLNNLPIAFADTELFRQLDLLDRPAVLLGMNALRVFDRVLIDFANRRLRLQLPTGGPSDTPLLAQIVDDTPSSAEYAATGASRPIGD